MKGRNPNQAIKVGVGRNGGGVHIRRLPLKTISSGIGANADTHPAGIPAVMQSFASRLTRALGRDLLKHASAKESAVAGTSGPYLLYEAVGS
jgi:hypothetical protein